MDTKTDIQNIFCEWTEDGFYAKYREGDVAKTVEVRKNPLTLEDYDKEENLLGIEVITN